MSAAVKHHTAGILPIFASLPEADRKQLHMLCLGVVPFCNSSTLAAAMLAVLAASPGVVMYPSISTCSQPRRPSSATRRSSAAAAARQPPPGLNATCVSAECVRRARYITGRCCRSDRASNLTEQGRWMAKGTAAYTVGVGMLGVNVIRLAGWLAHAGMSFSLH